MIVNQRSVELTRTTNTLVWKSTFLTWPSMKSLAINSDVSLIYFSVWVLFLLIYGALLQAQKGLKIKRLCKN